MGAEDGKRDESELEGCLGGVQIWRGARFDGLERQTRDRRAVLSQRKH